MKHYCSLALLTFFFNIGFAQEKHFVYIESENRQPFYVSVNGKSYSSTSSGYIIIPKLAEGEYTATIGFAGNTVPEQIFKYTVGQKDLGFDLKSLGEKGWGLFNQQTLTLITGQTGSTNVVRSNDNKPKEEEQGPEISFERRKDAAITPASKAEQQVAINETTPANSVRDSVPSLAANSSSAEIPSPATLATPAPVEQKTEVRTKRSRVVSNSKVKKVSEVKGDMGVYLTYEDSDEENRDTVQLIIPVDSEKKPQKKELVLKSSAGTGATTKRSSKKTKAESGSPQFLNIEGSNVKSDTNTLAVANAAVTASAISSEPATNSACTSLASENEYSKLRKKMASQTTEEAKMKEARKVFKNKCFTTMQIKGLSTLFLSDAERYRFFDVSYNVVADVHLYSSLEKELIDPYFINRFKAMLKK